MRIFPFPNLLNLTLFFLLPATDNALHKHTPFMLTYVHDGGVLLRPAPVALCKMNALWLEPEGPINVSLIKIVFQICNTRMYFILLDYIRCTGIFTQVICYTCTPVNELPALLYTNLTNLTNQTRKNSLTKIHDLSIFWHGLWFRNLDRCSN